MAGTDRSAIGRLWEERPIWFGIDRVERAGLGPLDAARQPEYVLVFGEPQETVRASYPEGADDAERGVLLGLIAFFEGDAPAPPAELEMTHSEAADVVRWLAERASAAGASEPRGTALRGALDAIDDGLPADVVTAFLYRAMESAAGGPPAHAPAPLEELRRTYERLGR